MPDNPVITHPDLQPPANQPAPAANPPEVDPELQGSLAFQKYGPDLKKVAKAYDEQFTETQRILSEHRQNQERLRLLENLVTSGGQPPGLKQSPFDRLADLGLPPDDLRAAFQEMLQPLYGALRAQSELAAEIPDLPTVSPEVQRFLNAHPDIAAESQQIADPKLSFKYAYRAYQASLDPSRRVSAAAPTGGAAPPTGGGNTAPRGDQPDLSALDKEVEDARKFMEETGDDRPFTLAWMRRAAASSGRPTHPSFA